MNALITWTSTTNGGSGRCTRPQDKIGWLACDVFNQTRTPDEVRKAINKYIETPDQDSLLIGSDIEDS